MLFSCLGAEVVRLAQTVGAAVPTNRPGTVVAALEQEIVAVEVGAGAVEAPVVIAAVPDEEDEEGDRFNKAKVSPAGVLIAGRWGGTPILIRNRARELQLLYGKRAGHDTGSRVSSMAGAEEGSSAESTGAGFARASCIAHTSVATHLLEKLRSQYSHPSWRQRTYIRSGSVLAMKLRGISFAPSRPVAVRNKVNATIRDDILVRLKAFHVRQYHHDELKPCSPSYSFSNAMSHFLWWHVVALRY